MCFWLKLPFSKPFVCNECTGDDMPGNIFSYAIAVSGHHQLWISLVSLAIAAISVAPIALQQRIINDAIEGKDFNLLALLCGLLLATILIRVALKYLLGLYQNWIAQSAIRTERLSLASDFAETSKSEIEALEKEQSDENNGAGKAVSVINNEIDIVGVFVGAGISDLVADGGKLLFAIGFMIWVDPLIALVATAFILPQVIIVPWLQMILNRLIRERTDQLRNLSDEVTELRDDRQSIPDAFENDLDAIFTNRIKAAAIKFLIKAIVNTLNALAPLSVLAFGGYMFIQGETTIGTIVAFTTGFDRASGPLRALVNYYRLASVRHEQYTKIREWKQRLGD